ncbi:MAG: HypC/HybG/HupF family hydrogenase formation chaperone [Candidatus Omnitrophica bacterium]|nr:HypC/HybG/HupF family hydrogenase formation chaperone [Candidatus Omnitrophota bacterium]
MCLAIPSRIVEIYRDGTALVEAMGVRRKVSLDLLEEAKEGDWVLVHVGFAIQRLKEEEAIKTLELFKEIMERDGS